MTRKADSKTITRRFALKIRKPKNPLDLAGFDCYFKEKISLDGNIIHPYVFLRMSLTNYSCYPSHKIYS